MVGCGDDGDDGGDDGGMMGMVLAVGGIFLVCVCGGLTFVVCKPKKTAAVAPGAAFEDALEQDMEGTAIIEDNSVKPFAHLSQRPNSQQMGMTPQTSGHMSGQMSGHMGQQLSQQHSMVSRET